MERDARRREEPLTHKNSISTRRPARPRPAPHSQPPRCEPLRGHGGHQSSQSRPLTTTGGRLSSWQRPPPRPHGVPGTSYCAWLARPRKGWVRRGGAGRGGVESVRRCKAKAESFRTDTIRAESHCCRASRYSLLLDGRFHILFHYLFVFQSE